MTLADVDGNGTLDLYVANYGENSILRSGGTISTRAGPDRKPVVAGRLANRLKIVNGVMIEFGEIHGLYLNDGQGHFTKANWTDGTFLNEEGQPLRRAYWDLGLSAMFRDLNGDGAPDLYVCNDFQCPDRIWINDGTGKFRALPDTAIRSTSHFSMGVDFADIDRDGYDEIFVCDMLSPNHHLRMTQIGQTNPPPEMVGEAHDRNQVRRNTLQWNRGDLTFAEIANFSGTTATDWSWTPLFLDVDLDGFEDLLISNGHAYDTQDLDVSETPRRMDADISKKREGRSLKEYPALRTPNVAFRNRGNRTFELVSAQWGFNSTQVSHGLIVCDLDNDGDLDVVVSCLWDPPLIYRNDSDAPRVGVRLRGKGLNTQGIGSKITVRGGPVPTQTQEVICGGRYLSGDDPMRVFAAGSLTNILTIDVTWRNGSQSVVTNVTGNHIYEIDETAAQPKKPVNAVPAQAPPLFQDVSNRAPHQHVDPASNEFDRQPLLPKQLGHLGPGIGWMDLDADGHDDLVIGAGQNGYLALFHGDGKGGFSAWEFPALRQPAADDHTGLAFWTAGPGRPMALIGLANYESPDSTPSSVLGLEYHSGGMSLAAMTGTQHPDSGGPLCTADVNHDGTLDVFVGGRVIPGRWPEAASSQLYLNHNGHLTPDPNNQKLFKKIGLVSGAVFSDLNGDGWPDLILACEWGAIRILLNDAGKFSDVSEQWGTAKWLGWWNSVTAGDFDGDGKMDLIAGNWGLNSGYGNPTQYPLGHVYARTCPLWGNAIERRSNSSFETSLSGNGSRGPASTTLVVP